MDEAGLEARIPPADIYSRKIDQTARHIANYTNTLDDGQWALIVSEVELIRAERADRRRGQKTTEEETLQEQALERLSAWLVQVCKFRLKIPQVFRPIPAENSPPWSSHSGPRQGVWGGSAIKAETSSSGPDPTVPPR